MKNLHESRLKKNPNVAYVEKNGVGEPSAQTVPVGIDRVNVDEAVAIDGVDDLIDVEQQASHTGKMTGKDRDADKLTYPGVIGVEASRAEAERLREEAACALSPLGDRARTLHALAAYLACRTR